MVHPLQSCRRTNRNLLFLFYNYPTTISPAVHSLEDALLLQLDCLPKCNICTLSFSIYAMERAAICYLFPIYMYNSVAQVILFAKQHATKKAFEIDS